MADAVTTLRHTIRHASSAAHRSPARTVHQIRDVASARAAARLPRGSVVTLAVPGIDAGAAAHFQSRISSQLGECGCRQSALFLVVAVCAAIVINVWEWPAVRQAPLIWLAAEMLLAFLVSGVGRIMGIANARRRLRSTLNTVCAQINHCNS